MIVRREKRRTPTGTYEAGDKENYCCHEVMITMMLKKRRKRKSRTTTTRTDDDKNYCRAVYYTHATPMARH